MKYLLPLLIALLTLAAAVVLVGALSSFSAGVGGVAFGVTEKFLTGLLVVLSALFIVLLAIYRRRERRKRT
jgi:hypothetical protein